MLVVVTGTPGVGKTASSSLLAEKLGGVHIDINKFALENDLVVSYDERRKTFVVNVDGLRQKLSEEVGGLLRKHPVVVAESHLAQHVVRGFEVRVVFVLRRCPLELVEVLRGRGYSEEKVWENVEAEFLDVCLIEALEAFGRNIIYEIDCTGRSPEDVASEMVVAIRRGVFGRLGVVDWMTRLEQKGVLDQVLSRFAKA